MTDTPRQPVCLLHGFLGAGADWDGVLSAEPAHRTCVTPDLQRIADAEALMRSGMDALARGALAACRELAGPNGVCDLVGYSLGGRVALAALAMDAELESRCLRRVVLVSSTAGLDERSEADARLDRLRIDEQRAAELERAGLPEFLRQWYAQPMFAPLRQSPAWRMVAERRALGDARWNAAALRHASPGRASSHWDLLGRRASQIRTIIGSLDGAYVAHARRITEHGVAPAQVIADAGHAVHLERPAATAAAIWKALDDSGHDHHHD